MIEATWLFFTLLFVVGFLYASVGHGGASGYLALMAVFAVPPSLMRPTALLLNLFVSLIAFVQFYRAQHFRWRIFVPLGLASVPMAFVGGLLVIDGETYKRILGLLLLVPIARFVFFDKDETVQKKEGNVPALVLLGGVIGLISGTIGIGGGIILSPVLLLLNWTNQKETAAISALFIFINSAAGLGGQLTRGVTFTSEMYWYVLVAFAGGSLGAYFGAVRFQQKILKNILAIVLLVAAFKLLFTHA